MSLVLCYSSSCFFFNDTATTEIYTLSLHDALPIYAQVTPSRENGATSARRTVRAGTGSEAPPTGSVGSIRTSAAGAGSDTEDRKSTRLNSSHANISYAVFCLKKKQHLTTLTSTSTL